MNADPRTVATAATVVGLLLILAGLVDLALESRRALGDFILLVGGALMVFAGRRFLRT